MWLLKRLTQHLLIAIPVTMLLGLACGLLLPVGWMKSLVIPLTFLMVYPMMVNLKLKKVLEGGDLRAQWLAQAINFLIIPFIAFALGGLFLDNQPYLALGLLLAALLPTSGMTISWTGFAGGNLGAAVKITVAGLILGSLATPLYVRGLMGTAIPVDMTAIFMQVVLIVLLPMVAGHYTQAWLVRRHGMQGFQERWAPNFPPLSTLGVLGIAFVAIALQARTLVAAPGVLLVLIPPLLCLYAINYALSTLIARAFLPRGDALALVFGTVMRNLSIALALAINAFGSAGAETALLIALAYVVQIQSAAWYVKFADRLFGPR